MVIIKINLLLLLLLLLCLYRTIYFWIRHFIKVAFVYMELYILSIKENMKCQNSSGMFNYRIKFQFNIKIIIMWRNIRSSTKTIEFGKTFWY